MLRDISLACKIRATKPISGVFNIFCNKLDLTSSESCLESLKSFGIFSSSSTLQNAVPYVIGPKTLPRPASSIPSTTLPLKHDCGISETIMGPSLYTLVRGLRWHSTALCASGCPPSFLMIRSINPTVVSRSFNGFPRKESSSFRISSFGGAGSVMVNSRLNTWLEQRGRGRMYSLY